MKRSALLSAGSLIAGSLLMAQDEPKAPKEAPAEPKVTKEAQAGPKDEVQNAIAMLAKKANYTWTTTTERPPRDGDQDQNDRRGGGGSTTGKTADGLVYTSSSFGDRTFESLRKGEKVAVKRDEGWSVLEPRGDDDNNDGEGRRRGRGRAGFGRGITAPDVQAAELLEGVDSLKKDGDVYVGALTDEGAKALMSFGRGRRGGDDNADRPQPEGVKGTAKFWIKDGVLAKYETSVAGSITFRDTPRDLSRTTTVEIKDVGSTKIDVPEETKKQLQAE